MDQYIQKWLSEIDNTDKHIYTNYRMYKDTFACEAYLTVLPINQAVSLIRFRTLNNRLPVQVERFCNISRFQRVCTKCDMNDVGDEYHVLFVCPCFSQHRSQYIPGFYWKKPSALKFSALFSTGKKKILSNLVKFIGIVNEEFKVIYIYDFCFVFFCQVRI